MAVHRDKFSVRTSNKEIGDTITSLWRSYGLEEGTLSTSFTGGVPHVRLHYCFIQPYLL